MSRFCYNINFNENIHSDNVYYADFRSVTGMKILGKKIEGEVSDVEWDLERL